MTPKDPLLLIVSSPSGAGKTTLCSKLLANYPDLRFSTSHTTRKPRKGEVDGKDYYFVDDTTFEQMVEDDQFIESARVHGHRYGTARSEIDAAAAANTDLIFDVDYQGASQIRAQYPLAVCVFVLPPSIEVLRSRLTQRGTESQSSLERRFKAALKEISHHAEFHYLLVNDELDVAYGQLRSILEAERIRHDRIAHAAEKLLKDFPKDAE